MRRKTRVLLSVLARYCCWLKLGATLHNDALSLSLPESRQAILRGIFIARRVICHFRIFEISDHKCPLTRTDIFSFFASVCGALTQFRWQFNSTRAGFLLKTQALRWSYKFNMRVASRKAGSQVQRCSLSSLTLQWSQPRLSNHLPP